MNKRSSKIYITILIIGSFFVSPALAYKTTVHDAISLHASTKSNNLRRAMIDVGLLDLDQFVDGDDVRLISNKLSWWIQHGSVWEDDIGYRIYDPLLPNGVLYNHFYNPLNNQGYTDNSGDIKGQSLIERLHDGYNDWSYEMSKKLYYAALTGDTSAIVKDRMWDGLSWLGTPVHHGLNINQEGREQFFVWTLQALGHTIHLIQDASVPAHTRNDLHSYLIPPGALEPYEKWTSKNLKELTDDKYFSKPGSELWTYWKENTSYIPNLHTFIDTNQLDEASTSPIIGNNQGLAEYSNANFVSNDTIGEFNLPTILPRDAWILDYADGNYTLEEKTTSFGKKLFFVYLKNKVVGVDHFLLSGVFHQHLPEWPKSTIIHSYDLRYTVNDDLVSKDYAANLIPRAVGYSAGFLDYFFRGKLEISPPGQYVYSVIDGSEVDPISGHQLIKTLKAKVRNNTPDEEMLDGELVAVAKYKKIIGYQADLESGEPTPGMREETFSYSASVPIAVSSISSTVPEEFTFDFTNSPIPAGITDLYLQVVFKGTLGNETEQAIAVGTRDLREPQHITIWNDTDYFQLFGVLMTAEEVREQNPLVAEISYVDPFPFTETIGFSREYPEIDAQAKITIQGLPDARYSRIIVIADAADSSYFLTDNIVATWPGFDPPGFNATWKYSIPAIEHQESNVGGWKYYSSNVYRNRGIVQHYSLYLMNAYPELYYTTDIPESPKNIQGPFPVTIH